MSVNLLNLRPSPLLLVACAATTPPMTQPRGTEPAQLARLLHEDIEALGEIAHRLAGQCDALIRELDAHVRVMQQHAVEAKAMAGDPAKGPQLKHEMAALPAGGDSDAIARDLASGYLACGEPRKEELRAVIDRIPDYTQTE